MAITANLTTITLEAAPVGCVTEFAIPSEEAKEVETTCLDSTIESFINSTLKAGQEFTFTVILDTEDRAVTLGDSGEWIVTLPIQTSPNVVASTYTFDGHVKMAGEVTGSASSDEALTQEFTIRLDSIIVVVDEVTV